MAEKVVEGKLTGIFEGLSWKVPTGTPTTFILGYPPPPPPPPGIIGATLGERSENHWLKRCFWALDKSRSLKRDNISQKYVIWGFLMCHWQFGEMPCLKLGKYGIFQFCPDLYLFLPKIKHSQPNKSYLSEMRQKIAITLESFTLLTIKL